MKILFLTTDYENGGAGIAASRMAEPLKMLGHHVQIESLGVSRRSRFFKKKRRILAKANRIFEFKLLRFARYSQNSYLAATFLPFNALGRCDFKHFDLVHIHWVNYGFISLRQAEKISKMVPTVWTLHSYWPFTAPYQYPGGKIGENYKENIFTSFFDYKLLNKMLFFR